MSTACGRSPAAGQRVQQWGDRRLVGGDGQHTDLRPLRRGGVAIHLDGVGSGLGDGEGNRVGQLEADRGPEVPRGQDRELQRPHGGVVDPEADHHVPRAQSGLRPRQRSAAVSESASRTVPSTTVPGSRSTAPHRTGRAAGPIRAPPPPARGSSTTPGRPGDPNRARTIGADGRACGPIGGCRPRMRVWMLIFRVERPIRKREHRSREVGRPVPGARALARRAPNGGPASSSSSSRPRWCWERSWPLSGWSTSPPGPRRPTVNAMSASTLAVSELEALRATPYADLGLSDSAPGFQSTYDGRPTVVVPTSTIRPVSTERVDGVDHTVRRHVTWESVSDGPRASRRATSGRPWRSRFRRARTFGGPRVPWAQQHAACSAP